MQNTELLKMTQKLTVMTNFSRFEMDKGLVCRERDIIMGGLFKDFLTASSVSYRGHTSGSYGVVILSI